ncbi:MAG: ferritin family protein [Desulfobaccales bacterium]
MKSLKGSKTEQNLIRLFALESQDRNRYSYFSSQAKKEGFVQVAAIFEETANQEKEHAKRLFKFFQGGNVECTSSYPAYGAGTTLDNLKMAVSQKEESFSFIYPEVARQAREEGFVDIAIVVEGLVLAEQHQGRRFSALTAVLEAGQVFRRNEPVTWRCRNCGYVCHDYEAPESCVACAHGQAHFEVLGETFFE